MTGQQVIEWEKPSSTDGLIQTIRSCKAEINRLREYRRKTLSREFQALVDANTEVVLRHFRVPGFEFRPDIVIKKAYGLKKIECLVRLRPRVRFVSRTIRLGNGRLVRTRSAESYVPLVRRTRWVPNYQKLVVRKAGMYRRKATIARPVAYRDWSRIRSEFASYKKRYDVAYRTAVDELNAQIRAAYKAMSDRPKLMQSYTTLGATSLYQLGQSSDPTSMVGDAARLRIITKIPGELPSPFRMFLRASGQYMYCARSYEELKELRRPFERERSWRPDDQEGTPSRLYSTPERGQGQVTMVAADQLEQTFQLTSEERLAYSSVASLTKGGDYSFQWFRSLLELKDFKSAVASPENPINKTVTQFLSWLIMHEILASKASYEAGVTSYERLLRKAQKAIDAKLGKHVFKVVPDKGYGAILKGWSLWKYLCRAYLCYKFAIEPTVADVETLERNTQEWIFGLRRTLATVLDRMQQPSNIFHARAKFGASSRSLKLGVYYTPDWAGYETIDGEHFVTVDVSSSVTLPAAFLHYKGDVAVYEGDPANAELERTDKLSDFRWQLSYPGEGGEILVSSPLRADVASYPVWFPTQTGQLYEVPTDPNTWTIDHLSPTSIRGTEVDLSDPVAVPDEGYRVVLKLPIYACSLTQGVAFASFVMKDVMMLSRELRLLCERLKGNLDSEWWEIVKHSFDHLDTVFVTWELTPLSFVYDWLTDSHSIIQELNNLIRKDFGEGVPNPLYGVWETRRSELLTGTVRCQPDSIRVYQYVSSWHTVRATDQDGQEAWLCAAEGLRLRYRFRYRVTDDKVHLTRSGLYRVRRGEHLGYSDIFHYLPHVQVKLTGGKLATLAALLSSLAGR
jgi:hypothetical protein